MGFFDDLVNTVARVGTAIVTGGTSEILRAVDPRLGIQAQALLFPTTPRQLLTTAALAAAPLTFGASSALGARALAGQLPTSLVPQTSRPAIFQPAPSIGVQPMGFDLGGFLGGVGQALSGSSNGILSGIGNVAQIGSNFVPAVSSPVPMMMTGPAPMVVSNTGVAVARVPKNALTREVFEAGAKVLSRIGLGYPASAGGFTSVLKRALSSMGSLARRTPAGTIVSILVGLGLTVYESNLLVAWHSQRKKGRRMNPANSKALRRAARRIRGFHKLCQHVDLLKTKSKSRSFSRCPKCRKSPCRC